MRVTSPGGYLCETGILLLALSHCKIEFVPDIQIERSFCLLSEYSMWKEFFVWCYLHMYLRSCSWLKSPPGSRMRSSTSPATLWFPPTISPSPPRLKYAFSPQKDVFGQGLDISTLPQLAIYWMVWLQTGNKYGANINLTPSISTTKSRRFRAHFPTLQAFSCEHCRVTELFMMTTFQFCLFFVLPTGGPSTKASLL
jgi:hypothetical protein